MNNLDVMLKSAYYFVEYNTYHINETHLLIRLQHNTQESTINIDPNYILHHRNYNSIRTTKVKQHEPFAAFINLWGQSIIHSTIEYVFIRPTVNNKYYISVADIKHFDIFIANPYAKGLFGHKTDLDTIYKVKIN